MPVTVEGTPTTGTAVGSASSITFSHTTSGDGLFVGGSSIDQLTSSCTFNAASMTELWDVRNADAAENSSGYLLIGPDNGTAHNVVMTWAGVADAGVAGAVGLDGLEQSSIANAHRTVHTDEGANNPSVTVVDSVNNDLVIDSAICFSGTIAVDAGQTSRCEDDAIGGGSHSWGISTEVATGGNTVMSWTGGTFHATGATALIAAAAAASFGGSGNSPIFRVKPKSWGYM